MERRIIIAIRIAREIILNIKWCDPVFKVSPIIRSKKELSRL